LVNSPPLGIHFIYVNGAAFCHNPTADVQNIGMALVHDLVVFILKPFNFGAREGVAVRHQILQSQNRNVSLAAVKERNQHLDELFDSSAQAKNQGASIEECIYRRWLGTSVATLSHISSRKKPTHRKWTCGPEGPSSYYKSDRARSVSGVTRQRDYLILILVLILNLTSLGE
jgi:hypothetical protein